MVSQASWTQVLVGGHVDPGPWGRPRGLRSLGGGHVDSRTCVATPQRRYNVKMSIDGDRKFIKLVSLKKESSLFIVGMLSETVYVLSNPMLLVL